MVTRVVPCPAGATDPLRAALLARRRAHEDAALVFATLCAALGLPPAAELEALDDTSLTVRVPNADA